LIPINATACLEAYNLLFSVQNQISQFKYASTANSRLHLPGPQGFWREQEGSTMEDSDLSPASKPRNKRTRTMEDVYSSAAEHMDKDDGEFS
jgi:hypothetical protein